MANDVKFDRDAFRQGVDDILTFAPLRHAFMSMLAPKKSGPTAPRGSKITTAAEDNTDECGRRAS